MNDFLDLELLSSGAMVFSIAFQWQ